MLKPLLLQAFEGSNVQVPVWFMRQAGRYLPQYQTLKQKYSLNELFATPELAAEITCQPVNILGVDAAIMFADILTLPGAMGFDIHFDNKKGPIIENTIKDEKDLSAIHDFSDLSHITKIIHIVNEKLPDNIPLIGFAGGPFSLLSYLIEGGSSQTFAKTYAFIHTHPNAFSKIMESLTKNTIKYLKLQKVAGVKLFQLFDTWAGILRPTDYAHWVLPYVEEIFAAVDLPSIYFVKNSGHLLALMDKTEADFLSIGQTIVLGHHMILSKTKKGIQGNLCNGLVFANKDTLKREVNDVLLGAQKHNRFIFNFNHGVLPNTDVDQLKFVVDTVHAFPWKKQKKE